MLIENIGEEDIVLSRAESLNRIFVPREQIESLAEEIGCTAGEIVKELTELVASGAMGEGWDVSRFYNMPVASVPHAEGWDVSRFYSMPFAAGEGWDVSRFYNMPAKAASDEGWDVSRFYSMPENQGSSIQ